MKIYSAVLIWWISSQVSEVHHSDHDYRGDLNTDHLTTKLFEVRISNGLVFKWSGYVLCPMYLTNQYLKKQDGVHLSGFQMVGLAAIQMASKYWTIWHPISFQPFEYQTIRYSDPQCIRRNGNLNGQRNIDHI